MRLNIWLLLLFVLIQICVLRALAGTRLASLVRGAHRRVSPPAKLLGPDGALRALNFPARYSPG
ncbi:MAG: hypothetical protein ACYC3L_07660, partial [Gemmatimonadaceae bacterium]